jgi:hypothetical protein
MPAPAIPYDTSADGVFHPERRDPLAMDATWPADAVAAEFCRLSYFRFEGDPASRDVIARAVARIGYGDMGFFSGSDPGLADLDAQGFAAINSEGHAIITFRGTQPDSLRDLLTDLSIGLTDWPGPGRVHEGFWRSLEAIHGQIDRWIVTRHINRLTITGHSLGAALATLLAVLRRDGALVTFGAPLIGDAAFAAAVAGLASRVYVDCTDLVPTLPPSFLGYAHAGGLRYIDADGAVHGPADLPLSDRDHRRAYLAYAPYLLIPGNAPGRKFADHAPINYISAILRRRIGP